MAHIKGKSKGKAQTKKQLQCEVLSAFEEFANITRACKKCNVPRRTFYNWLDEPKFKEEYDKSCTIALGTLEDEATRRAIEGTLKPVFYLGKKVGTIREYSDTLTIVLLKARAPQKYKERVSNEISGVDGSPIETTHKIVFEQYVT